MKNIIRLKSVDSTNSYAKKILRGKKALDGTAILADFQSAGKGQKGNYWESNAGENILLSLIHFPKNTRVEDQFQINMKVSLALIKYLKTHDISAKIKWPNDIYVGDKKIAGILIEHMVQKGHISATIIGIGININQLNFSDNLPNPVSLRKVCDNEYKIQEEAEKLLEKLSLFLGTMDNSLSQLKINYINNLYQWNTLLTFQAEEEIFEGRIKDINEAGQIIIVDEKNVKRVFGFKEIEMAN